MLPCCWRLVPPVKEVSPLASVSLELEEETPINTMHFLQFKSFSNVQKHGVTCHDFHGAVGPGARDRLVVDGVGGLDTC